MNHDKIAKAILNDTYHKALGEVFKAKDGDKKMIFGKPFEMKGGKWVPSSGGKKKEAPKKISSGVSAGNTVSVPYTKLSQIDEMAKKKGWSKKDTELAKFVTGKDVKILQEDKGKVSISVGGFGIDHVDKKFLEGLLGGKKEEPEKTKAGRPEPTKEDLQGMLKMVQGLRRRGGTNDAQDKDNAKQEKWLMDQLAKLEKPKNKK